MHDSYASMGGSICHVGREEQLEEEDQPCACAVSLRVTREYVVTRTREKRKVLCVAHVYMTWLPYCCVWCVYFGPLQLQHDMAVSTCCDSRSRQLALLGLEHHQFTTQVYSCICYFHIPGVSSCQPEL